MLSNIHSYRQLFWAGADTDHVKVVISQGQIVYTFFFIRTSSLRTFLKMFLTLDQQEAIYFVLIKKTCSLHKIGMYGKTLGENREINNKIGKNQNFHILVVSIGILP